MRKSRPLNGGGFTITELVVAMVVLMTFAIAVMAAYSLMVGSAATARLKSAGLSLATEQLEYIKSLPYDNLAIAGGSIETSATKLPATKEETVFGTTFTITTTITYADDAYDGCLNYPVSQNYLCRNGPPKTGTPVDTNPRDYKLVDVVVKVKTNNKEVSRVSSSVAARVAETGGGTGALLVTVVDSTGQPIGGATVQVTNTTLSPSFNQSVTSDVNGVALFLDVKPDNGKDFIINVSKAGYSSLSTISASGSLAPTYPNVSVLAQQVTSSTLKIDPVASDSLTVSVVDSDGSARPNSKFSIRGGIKLYTNVSDQSYGFTQAAVTTDAAGQYTFHNLVPGPYQVCFTNYTCETGRYLVAGHATYGDYSFQPFSVAAGSVNSAGALPMQTIKLFTSSSSSYPIISKVDPAIISASSASINASEFTITGKNISNAVVLLRQSGVDILGSKVGTDSSTSIRRSFDLTAKTGAWELVVTSAGGSVSQNGLLPGTLGGINVTP